MVPLFSELNGPLAVLIFKLNILGLVDPLCWGIVTGNNKFAICLEDWFWEPLVVLVDVWDSWDITGAITNFGLVIWVVVKAPVWVKYQVNK